MDSIKIDCKQEEYENLEIEVELSDTVDVWQDRDLICIPFDRVDEVIVVLLKAKEEGVKNASD